MARALFDVNFLIALFLPSHVHNKSAQRWWDDHEDLGWASCPITENGFVRIVSQPNMGSDLSSAGAIAKLDSAKSRTKHEFWPDSLSLTDTAVFNRQHILSHKQLTDTYLLALAKKHQGTLVTFDKGIVIASVSGANESNLVTL